jgi:hypothetical protein
MKRNFKYILYTGMVCGALLASCSKDFLDQPPYTSINAGEALATDADILTALNGTYAGMRNSNLYGRSLPLLGDLQADNVFISNRNAGRYTGHNLNNFVVNNADVLGIWENAYRVILRANNIINAKPTVASQANVNQYVGEAYAIRALMYFELVRTFARPYTDNPAGLGVPIVLDFNIDAKPQRATVEETYAQILADLDKAYELMTLKPTTARLSKFAARGLAAKVNLFKGTPASNQLAFDQAVEVINGSNTTLLTAGNFSTYWASSIAQTSATANETLFEVVSDQIDNAGFDELAYFYGQQGYGDGLANPLLYNLYSATDVRKSLIQVGVRTRAENPAYIIRKYPDLVNYGTKKILRLSDVYLIAAEAAYNLGRPEATTYLQTLVTQRDPAAVVTETGPALFERIITERRKELAFEGDRFFTLNRLKRDITDRGGSVKTIPYADFRRVAPIPLSELDRNPITQNPGWQ